MFIRTSVLALLSTVGIAQSAILEFDLSPAGTSAAVGLAAANTFPAVTTSSTGTGNEISNGITYNTDTNTLTLAVGFGLSAGFTNLTGTATAAHLHGPAAAGASGVQAVDLSARLFAAGTATQGGIIFGNVTLTDAQELDLLNDLIYLDVHTAANVNGELRAQLVRANSAPEIDCEEEMTVECGKSVTLSAGISDFDGDAVKVEWTLNGDLVKTTNIAADATPPTNLATTLTTEFHEGSNLLTVTATDSEGDVTTCDIIVTAEDTVAPVIKSLSVSPKVLWPPNNKMVNVTVDAKVSDACDENPRWKIVSVTSNQSAGKDVDIKITGQHTVSLRAQRTGKDKDGRTYTIKVVALDDAGNKSAPETVTVTVPHDQRK